MCVRTYRLFYVSRTEDVLWRGQAVAERERAMVRLATREAGRARRLEEKLARGGVWSETAAIEQ